MFHSAKPTVVEYLYLLYNVWLYLSKPIISNLPDLDVWLHTGVCVELGKVTSLFTQIYPVCTSFTDDDNFDGKLCVCCLFCDHFLFAHAFKIHSSIKSQSFLSV
jgi:hypothetical protein